MTHNPQHSREMEAAGIGAAAFDANPADALARFTIGAGGGVADAPRTVTDAAGRRWQFNPATNRYDIPVGAAPAAETSGSSTTTDAAGQRWQFNPETGRYDIAVGAAPAPATGSRVTYSGTIDEASGELILLGSDGSVQRTGEIVSFPGVSPRSSGSRSRRTCGRSRASRPGRTSRTAR